MARTGGVAQIRGEIANVRADIGEVADAGKRVGLERDIQNIELELAAGATPENKKKAVEALQDIAGEFENVMDDQDVENYFMMDDDAIDADLILRTTATLPATHPLNGTVVDVLPTSKNSPAHLTNPDGVRVIDDQRVLKLKQDVDVRRDRFADRIARDILAGADLNATIAANAVDTNGNPHPVLEQKIRDRYNLLVADRDAQAIVAGADSAQDKIANLRGVNNLPPAQRDALVNQVRDAELNRLEQLADNGALGPVDIQRELAGLDGVDPARRDDLLQRAENNVDQNLGLATQAIAAGNLPDADILAMANGNPVIEGQIQTLLDRRDALNRGNTDVNTYINTPGADAIAVMDGLIADVDLDDTERQRLLGQVRQQALARLQQQARLNGITPQQARDALNDLAPYGVTDNERQGVLDLLDDSIGDAADRQRQDELNDYYTGVNGAGTAILRINNTANLTDPERQRLIGEIRANEIRELEAAANAGTLTEGALRAVVNNVPGIPTQKVNELRATMEQTEQRRGQEQGRQEVQDYVNNVRDADDAINRIDARTDIDDQEKQRLAGLIRQREVRAIEDGVNNGDIGPRDVDAALGGLNGVDANERARLRTAAEARQQRVLNEIQDGLEDGTLDNAQALARVAGQNPDLIEGVQDIIRYREGEDIVEDFLNGNRPARAAQRDIAAIANIKPGAVDQLEKLVLDKELEDLKNSDLNVAGMTARLAGLHIEQDQYDELIRQAEIIDGVEAVVNSGDPLSPDEVYNRLDAQLAFQHLPQEVRERIRGKLRNEYGAGTVAERNTEDNTKRELINERVRIERRRAVREEFLRDFYRVRAWLMDAGVVGAPALAALLVNPAFILALPVAGVLRLKHHYKMIDKADDLQIAALERNLKVSQLQKDFRQVFTDRQNADLKRYGALAKGIEGILINGARPELTEEQKKRMVKEVQFRMGNIDMLQKIFNLSGTDAGSQTPAAA